MSRQQTPTGTHQAGGRASGFFDQLHHGGDYNPEQWPEEIWDDDVTLMQRAGVTIATVAVFSWSRLEPRPGEYDFAWLDKVLDLLHGGGIRVMLATATASPPPWLSHLHPESLPVTVDGIRLGPGSRQHYNPSSEAYRRYALRLVERIAERYGSHPALAAWHINNEYGCHVSRSYDDETADHFRRWLAEKYQTVEALNDAWGTSFWSQHYDAFEEISLPRAAPAFLNPTQMIDFDRFSSGTLLDLYRAELEILRRFTPDVPVTTNFMGFFKSLDYWEWARHLDFISDDVYPDPTDTGSYAELAAKRDFMRSLGAGRPWLVMESATSAVQWRDINAPKPAGMHRVESIQAIARGADGVLHFQWRQSLAGAERFHSAMVPHAGPDSRVFREVCSFGEELRTLTPEILGKPVPAQVAIIVDWDSWRAVEQGGMPAKIDYLARVLDWHRPFLDVGVTVDFRAPNDDLSSYALVVAPMLHVVSDATAANLDGYVRSGGHLVIGCFSGVVDENLHAWLGGYLGPLRGLLGVRVEEFAPYGDTELEVVGDLHGYASHWQDVVIVDDAVVLARFGNGFAAGHPAITRRIHGQGTAWYVGTMPGQAILADLVNRWIEQTGIPHLIDKPTFGVEAVQRGDTLFVINHTDQNVTVAVQGRSVALGAYGVDISRNR